MHLLLVVVYIFFWRSSAGQYTKHDFYLISIKNVDNIDGEHRVMRLARIFFCDWRHLRSRWAGFGRRKRIRNKIQTRSTRESKKKRRRPRNSGSSSTTLQCSGDLVVSLLVVCRCVRFFRPGESLRNGLYSIRYGRLPAKVVEMGVK